MTTALMILGIFSLVASLIFLLYRTGKKLAAVEEKNEHLGKGLENAKKVVDILNKPTETGVKLLARIRKRSKLQDV